MDVVKKQDYNIDIFKLSNNSHQYKFNFDESFFDFFKYSFVNKGHGEINLTLLKSDSFIELTFEITGKIKLICDRSLDTFWFNLTTKNKLLFKFGDNWEELSDEILIMPKNEQTINISKYIYEFIVIAIPMKKLHPKFNNENEEDELIYLSKKEPDDPRWEKLKKIKNKK
jgi:uncharacterized metal-binding protein YceD (DUF177 family)